MNLSAVDVGFNSVKALASNGRHVVFPSVVGTERRETFSLEEVKRAGLTLTMGNGRTWSVGRTALERAAYSAGRRDPGWVRSEPYRVLVCAALSELHKGTTRTKIVSGLPLEDWAAYHEALSGVLVGDHRFRREGGNWQTVTVDEALVVTQPYGSLLDKALSPRGRILDNVFATATVAIADLGGNTLNLLVADALEEVGQWTQGDGLGLLRALDAIARDVHADCPGISPRAREVSGWLAAGVFPYKGEERKIGPYADRHLEPLVELVLNRLSEVWSEPGRYSAVLLTGGGAEALGGALKGRMNGLYANVGIARDAVFANVRGYLKLARKLWG